SVRAGDRLFISLPSGNSVAVLDAVLSGAPVQAPGSPDPVPGGARGPAGLALTADGRILQVVNRASNQIVTFTAQEDGRLEGAPFPPSPTGILAANPSAGIVFEPTSDEDGDGFERIVDDCPRTYNPGQEDADHDGAGDACQPT